LRYARFIREQQTTARIHQDVPPLAGIIGLMGAEAPDRAVAPHAVVPIYILRPDAVLAREKKGRRRKAEGGRRKDEGRRLRK
jgi:hypothetical protein